MGVRRPHRNRRRHRPDTVLHRDREPGRCLGRAASAASDALHTAAAALGSRDLRQAAEDYDRAARQPFGQIPGADPGRNQLRHAARLISAYAYLTQDRWLTPIVLLIRLAALAEAVAEWRESQQRAHQAAAALRAARHLHAATAPAAQPRPAPSPRARPGPQADSAAHLAAMSSPKPARPGRQPPAPGPDPARAPPPGDRHHHGHADPPANRAASAPGQVRCQAPWRRPAVSSPGPPGWNAVPVGAEPAHVTAVRRVSTAGYRATADRAPPGHTAIPQRL